MPSQMLRRTWLSRIRWWGETVVAESMASLEQAVGTQSRESEAANKSLQPTMLSSILLLPVFVLWRCSSWSVSL